MARRFQSRIDPSIFLGGGGKEGDQNDMAMAMAMSLMGLGSGQRTPEEMGLTRQKTEADIRNQELAQQIALMGEQRLGTSAQQEEAFRQWQKQAEADRAKAELNYKTAQDLTERQKSRDTVIKEYLGLTTDAAERRRLIDALSPEAKGDTLAQEALRQSNAAKVLLPQLKVAYEKGDVGLIKKLTEGVSPELLQRPEFEWQKWNQEMVPASHRGITGGQGLLGLLWNTPGALKNVGKGIANVASSALLGEGAPQVEYEKFTDPRRYRAEQLAQGGPSKEGPVRSEAPLAQLLEAAKFPNAVAPSQTTYNPTPGPTTQPEPYRYLTGNLPIPTTGIPNWQGFDVPELLRMTGSGYVMPGSEQEAGPEFTTVGSGYVVPGGGQLQRDYTVSAGAGEYAPGAAFSRQGLPDLRYTPPREPNAVDRLLGMLGF